MRKLSSARAIIATALSLVLSILTAGVLVLQRVVAEVEDQDRRPEPLLHKAIAALTD